jgi:hypothetical protein
MWSLIFFQFTYFFQPHFGSGVDLAFKRNRKCFWIIKCGRRIRLTTSPPSVSWSSRQCEIFDISQLHGPPLSIIGIALLFFFFILRLPSFSHWWSFRISGLPKFGLHFKFLTEPMTSTTPYVITTHIIILQIYSKGQSMRLCGSRCLQLLLVLILGSEARFPLRTFMYVHSAPLFVCSHASIHLVTDGPSCKTHRIDKSSQLQILILKCNGSKGLLCRRKKADHKLVCSIWRSRSRGYEGFSLLLATNLIWRKATIINSLSKSSDKSTWNRQTALCTSE